MKKRKKNSSFSSIQRNERTWKKSYHRECVFPMGFIFFVKTCGQVIYVVKTRMDLVNLVQFMTSGNNDINNEAMDLG